MHEKFHPHEYGVVSVPKKSHVIVDGHTCYRTTTHGSEKPESFTVYGVALSDKVSAIARMHDKVSACTTKVQIR